MGKVLNLFLKASYWLVYIYHSLYTRILILRALLIDQWCSLCWFNWIFIIYKYWWWQSEIFHIRWHCTITYGLYSLTVDRQTNESISIGIMSSCSKLDIKIERSKCCQPHSSVASSFAVVKTYVIGLLYVKTVKCWPFQCEKFSLMWRIISLCLIKSTTGISDETIGSILLLI